MNAIFFRKVLMFITISFIGVMFMGCNSFAGILYPKVFFDFHYQGEQPPETSYARLASGDKYPQTFTIFFSQAGNSLKKDLITRLFVKKPYERLHVKEMSYSWEGGQGIFLQDKAFELDPHTYISGNGWYWKGGLGRPLYSVNFERIFKKKKPGDKFNITLKIIYSFDNETAQIQTLKYEVVAVKGEYVSPFMGL